MKYKFTRYDYEPMGGGHNPCNPFDEGMFSLAMQLPPEVATVEFKPL